MKPLTAIIATAITAGILWTAGEQHRANCIDQNRTGCSVLPWESGRPMFQTATPGASIPPDVYCYRPDSTKDWLTACVARIRVESSGGSSGDGHVLDLP